ncbi:MAG: flagellin [Streptomyces sp.]
MSETTDTTSSALGQVLALVGTSPLTANKFDSWLREGTNEPITAADLTAVIPADIMNGLAEAANVSAADAATELAKELPTFVDALPADTVAPAVGTLLALGAADPLSDTAKALSDSQSRFQSNINTLNITVTNLSAARSRIQDTDYASTTAAYIQTNILVNAGNNVLAKVNQQPQMILILLRDM